MSGKCRKMGFWSKKECQEYLDLISQNNGKKGKQGFKAQRPYLCPVCDEFHLTSQSKSHARRVRYTKNHRNSDTMQTKPE